MPLQSGVEILSEMETVALHPSQHTALSSVHFSPVAGLLRALCGPALLATLGYWLQWVPEGASLINGFPDHHHSSHTYYCHSMAEHLSPPQLSSCSYILQLGINLFCYATHSRSDTIMAVFINSVDHAQYRAWHWGHSPQELFPFQMVVSVKILFETHCCRSHALRKRGLTWSLHWYLGYYKARGPWTWTWKTIQYPH